MNTLVQAELHARLSEIDSRLYQGRDALTVNQPSHRPTPREFVPSRSPLKP